MARPQLKIDAIEVEKLASFGLSTKEMAEFFNCSTDTLERRYAANLRRGRNNLRMRLRVKQVQVAMRGCPSMLRWLGIQYLKQTTRVEQNGDLKVQHNGNVEHEHKIPPGLLSPQETEVLDAVARRLARQSGSHRPSPN